VMSVYFGWCSFCSPAWIVLFAVANNRWYSVVCRISHSSLQHRSLLHGIFMTSSGSSGISSEASSTKFINVTFFLREQFINVSLSTSFFLFSFLKILI
jgi:hypothetical protein